MTSSEPLAYQRVLPLRPELQPWRMLIRGAAIFVLISTCVQLTSLGIEYLSQWRVRASLLSLNSSTVYWHTVFTLLLVLFVTCLILSLIAAIGCLLLVPSFRLFLLVTVATSAGTQLLMGGIQVYQMAHVRGWALGAGYVYLLVGTRNLSVLVFPAAICFFLAHRTTAEALAVPGESRRVSHRPLPLLLVWLGCLSGFLGTFIKPALLMLDARVTGAVRGQSPWALGGGWITLWSTGITLSNLLLWFMSFLLLVGSMAMLLGGRWTQPLVVFQARISVILTTVLLVLAWPVMRGHSSPPDYFVFMFTAAILSLMLDLALWIYFGRRDSVPPLIPAANSAPVPPAHAGADARSSAPPLPRS